MITDIKCPNCGHQFPMGEAVAEEYKKDLREQMIGFTRKKEEEFRLKQEELVSQGQSLQNELQKKWADEKRQMEQTLENQLRKSITNDFENKLTLLQQSNATQEEKLKEARHKELDYLIIEHELKMKEAELELTTQRRLQEERLKMQEEIRKLEEQKSATRESEYQLRLREMEKQLNDQKTLAEEMRRKAEQGSMQLQGESQELALEELLKANFPFDEISEVSKGKRGADCIHIVRNQFGQECGKIIYESKRTENFSADWIEKLKADMRSQGADLAVIVTKTMPRDMSHFGEKSGVWICTFADIKAVAHVLRDSIIRVYTAGKSQENKGDKMHLLYHYLTSNEFSEQWQAIREGFQSMKLSIQKEREAMERLWKSREKHLEKVLLNAVHIRASVEGIAGQHSIDLNLIGDDTEPDLLD